MACLMEISTLALDHRSGDCCPRVDSGRNEEEKRGQLASFCKRRQSFSWGHHAGPSAGNSAIHWGTFETAKKTAGEKDIVC